MAIVTSLPLGPRTQDVLTGLASGLTEKEVAYQLRISPHTVHVHVKKLHKHYGVSSRCELLCRWFRMQLEQEKAIALSELAPTAQPS